MVEIKNNLKSIFDNISIVTEGLFYKMFISNKPFITLKGNPVNIPNNIFKIQLENELGSYQEKQSNNLVTYNMLIKFADNIHSDKDESINFFLKYLDTDLLFYKVNTPSALVKLQEDSWGKIIQRFNSVFKTSWKVTNKIQPLKQDPASISIVKNYLNSLDNMSLQLMDSILKLTGSCLLTILCKQKELSYTEIWEAIYLEEIWYNKYLYKDSLRKKELEEKKIELESYLKLLDSL
ncbi:MAG: ATP12 family protein [Hyphomicrobiales bacterium]|nr:ATP12 family protein [Hyphomicrobiales bacterium]